MRIVPLIFLMMICAPAKAGLFSLESITSFSQFKDDDLKNSSPMFESMITNFVSTDERFNFSANVRLWHDNSRNEDQFNLYTFYANYWIVPNETRIEFGRTYQSFLTVRPKLLDMLSIEEYAYNRHVRFAGFYGIERPVEDLNQFRSESYGGQVGYVSQDIFPFSASLRLEQQSFDTDHRNRGRVSFRKPLLLPASPELMADFERDLDFKTWSKSEVGVDLFPTFRSQVSLRHQRYDLDPVLGVDEPIQHIFTEGAVEEVAIRLGYIFSEKFRASYYYAKSQYRVSPNIPTSGDRHGFDMNGHFSFIRPSLSFYRINSFGGDVDGTRGSVNVELRSNLEIYGWTDYTSYQKITSSKRAALNNSVGCSYWPKSHVRVDVSGESNRNNAHTRDERVLVQLTYLLWKET